MVRDRRVHCSRCCCQKTAGVIALIYFFRKELSKSYAEGDRNIKWRKGVVISGAHLRSVVMVNNNGNQTEVVTVAEQPFRVSKELLGSCAEHSQCYCW